jgi:MFS family permease
VPGFARIYTSLLLGRTAGQMSLIALILFVLERYHSPQLAGASAFLMFFPGLIAAPVAGALLDRYGRVPLIVVDFLIAALSLGLLAALSAGHALSPQLLLVIVAVAAITGPLSAAGSRSLFPILVPSRLWERANALDSGAHVVSSLVGAPVAGVLVGFAGGEWALAAAGALFASAGLAMLGVRDPSVRTSAGHVLADAWQGLTYVMRNPTLRGIAVAVSTLNLAFGCLNIAIPVLVLSRLHEGPATVGYLWGATGAAGLVAAVVAGRMRTDGRERQLMVASMLGGTAGLALLPFAAALPVVAVAMVTFGATNGLFDIAMFTLRQRRTDAAWFGRAFAVSMAANSLGIPIGSALAGPLIGWSLNLALWAAVAAALVATSVPLLMIPGKAEQETDLT